MGVNAERFTKALADAREIVERAKEQDRDFTASEKAEVDKLLKRAEGLKRNAHAETRIEELLGGGDAPAGSPGVKLSELVREAVPDFATKGLVDTPSLYVPSSFIASPVGTAGRAGDGSLWGAFPSRPVEGGSVSYLQSSMGATQGAAEVAPGAQKPTADWQLTRVDEPLKTFAVLTPYFADTLLSDSAEMSALLDSELSALIRVALDKHVESVLDANPGWVIPFATNALTSIRKGATAIQGAGFVPNAVAVNPADAEAFDLSVGTDGQFVLDVRTKDSSPIWSLNVIVSRALEVGKGFVVDTAAAGTSFLRSEAKVGLDRLQPLRLRRGARSGRGSRALRPAAEAGRRRSRPRGVSDERTETVVMAGAPRERGTPEEDAARNEPDAERFWLTVGDVDFRVHPIEQRRWPAVSLRGGFKR